MPLRDHFRPPLDNMRHWESHLAGWSVMIVASLRRKLPHHYFAEPWVHSGAHAEIDMATFHDGGETVVWIPPEPTLSVVTDLPTQDEYEVRIYDEKRHSRLVAAVELVSPANKDHPEHRRAFVAKCASLLRERVSVVIVDVVTTRSQNLYGELLEQIGQSDPTLKSGTTALRRRVPPDEARERLAAGDVDASSRSRTAVADRTALARR